MESNLTLTESPASAPSAHTPPIMVHGSWCMVHGSWLTVHCSGFRCYIEEDLKLVGLFRHPTKNPTNNPSTQSPSDIVVGPLTSLELHPRFSGQHTWKYYEIMFAACIYSKKLSSNNGAWFMIHTVDGSRFSIQGPWFTVHGSRFIVHVSQFMVHGSWFVVHGALNTVMVNDARVIRAYHKFD